MNARKLLLTSAGVAAGLVAHAQIPDLLTAFDAGGRAMGTGGGLAGTSTSTRAILDNPAGIGYTSAATTGLTFRNLTESRSIISGNFRDPDFRVDGQSGQRSVTHAGVALPMGRMGVLGISYQLGGFIRDTRVGNNLPDGELTVRNFRETLVAKSDFFTISLARAREDFSSAWGFGVVLANQYVRNRQTYQLFRADNSEVPTTPLDNRGTSYGVGVVAGYQSNVGSGRSIGLSLRSPISLQGGDEVAGYYRRIPGKASLGVAQRVKRGDDFFLVALQGDYYFGGDEGKILSRENQLAFGGGIEYYFKYRNATIPLRVGFRSVGDGGDGFSSLSGFTFGFGYQPDGSPFNLDVDLGSNSTGNMDMSLALTYRISK